LACCAALAGQAVADVVPDPRLVLAVEGETVKGGEQPWIVRSRLARLDLGVLRQAAGAGQPRPRLAIALFDDAGVTVEVTRADVRGPERFTCSGTVAGAPGSQATIAVRNGVVHGVVSVPGTGLFEIRHAGGGLHRIVQIDAGRLPGCGVGPQHHIGPRVAPAPRPIGAPGTVAVAVLVVYTPAARVAAGGESGILAAIDTAIAQTNEALSESQTIVQMALLPPREIAYVDSGDLDVDLARLKSALDGHMDIVHEWRAEVCADLVALLVAAPDADSCGVGYVMQSPGPSFAGNAFSVTAVAPCLADYAFSHELGHNMGCAHDHANANAPGAYPYSHGHRFTGDSLVEFRTIMAYPPGSRILQYSNPDVLFDGQPTGVPEGEPQPADNAQTIDNTAEIVAAFGGLCAEWCELPQLTGLPGNDSFGTSVAASGVVCIVSAPNSPVGLGYVFRHDGTGWSPEQVLGADEAGPVAVSGNVAVIAGEGYAAVYRYNGSSWVAEASGGGPDWGCGIQDDFGWSVAAGGDVFVVGAPYNDGLPSGQACAFRYNGSAWALDQQLLPGGLGNSIGFGWSVAVGGEYAVVGAPFDDDNGSSSGSAFVYQHNGSSWAFQQKLVASDGAASDWFGRSLAISGNRIIVGAPGDDDLGADSGSAYVYRTVGGPWGGEKKLVASDGAPGDRFGDAVAISGDVAAVGAPLHDHNGSDSGSAYAFRWNSVSWTEETELLPSSGAADDQFGSSVAASGAQIIVGAPEADGNGIESGSAHAFTAIEIDPFGSPPCEFCGNGVADPAEDCGNCPGDVRCPPGTDCVGGVCELSCPADLDLDGAVGVTDFLSLLKQWGTNPGGPPDLDGDGVVGITDFLDLLKSWGPCA
jgi:hypothetical protein